MPKVSVIIPVYNRAHYLREALTSVVSQTFRDFEVIVVDDGSTEDIFSVVRTFMDSRIKYIYQENKGQAAARNTALNHVQGEYIAFLDSDDLFLPHKLEIQASVLDEQPLLGAVAGGWRYIDENGKPLHEESPWITHPHFNLETWLFVSLILPVGGLIRASWLKRVGGFDERFRVMEDYELWVRMVQAGCQLDWVKSVVGCCRLHSDNQGSQVKVTRIRQEYVELLDKFFAQDNIPPNVIALKEKAYSQAHLRSAYRAYEAGPFDEAQADVARAIQLDPQLLADRGNPIFESLVARATAAWIPDPFAYINNAFDHLPDAAAVLRRRRHEAIAQAAMAEFFHAAEQKDWHTIRHMFGIAVLNNASWLRNRGVISIILEAVLGTQLMRAVRQLSRWIKSGLRTSQRVVKL